MTNSISVKFTMPLRNPALSAAEFGNLAANVSRPLPTTTSLLLNAVHFEQLAAGLPLSSKSTGGPRVHLVATPELRPVKHPMLEQEIRCLAQALYFEARGESRQGIRAVAEVIMNRVDSPNFPHSICEVVRQGADEKFKCQFSYYCDGKPESVMEPAAYAQIKSLATAYFARRRTVLTSGATHFHSSSVNPSWANRLVKTAKIGQHVFYREATKQ